MKPALCFAACFVVALACSRAAVSAEGESELFAFFALGFEGKLRGRVAADLNGDGLIDVAVLLSSLDDPDANRLETCLQHQDGFPGACTATPIPPETRVFDVGDIDGKPGAELVILTPEGIRVSSFRNGSFEPFGPLARVDTIFGGTDPAEPARLRFISDLDGGAGGELVLPHIEGPKILRWSNGELIQLQQLESRADITYRLGGGPGEEINSAIHGSTRRTEARFAAPEIFVEDFDGDGRRDVITLLGTALRVFRQEPAGSFPASPTLLLERSILGGDEREDPLAGEAATFSDLDGDGRSDLIAIKWGSPEQRTQIDRQIYYASAGLEFPDRPDQIVRSESAFLRFMVSDLNGDGRRDLVIPFFRFAPSQALKVITQNAVKIQFRLFLMGKDGRYAQGPGKSFAQVDRRVSLSYEFDILGILFDDKALPQGKLNPLISFNADANGDGYADLVADTGGDRLTFYWGNEKAEYRGSPDHVIHYESAMDFDLVDLNGDGKTDVITYYATRDRARVKQLRKSQVPGKRPLRKPRRAPVPADAKPRGPEVKVLLSR